MKRRGTSLVVFLVIVWIFLAVVNGELAVFPRTPPDVATLAVAWSAAFYFAISAWILWLVLFVPGIRSWRIVDEMEP